jgi:diaminobutyrate-2-oxoglutarate transaminase
MDYLSRDDIVHSPDLATTAKRKFIGTFRDLVLALRRLRYKLQFTAPTGANAVEAVIKLARQVTKPTNVIAFAFG